METRAALDSTYHYVQDSVVVYIQDATFPPAAGSPQATRSGVLLKGEPEGVSEVRWHTEWRERTLTRTDTVYQDREVQIQLPPERYVPRFYTYGTMVGVLAVIWLIVRMVLKIRKRLL